MSRPNRRMLLGGALACLGSTKVIKALDRFAQAGLASKKPAAPPYVDFGPRKPRKVSTLEQIRRKWTYAEWMEAFKARGYSKAKSATVSNIAVHKLIRRFGPTDAPNLLSFVYKDLDFWTDWRYFWGLDSSRGWPERVHLRVLMGQNDPIVSPSRKRKASLQCDFFAHV